MCNKTDDMCNPPPPPHTHTPTHKIYPLSTHTESLGSFTLTESERYRIRRKLLCEHGVAELLGTVHIKRLRIRNFSLSFAVKFLATKKGHFGTGRSPLHNVNRS